MTNKLVKRYCGINSKNIFLIRYNPKVFSTFPLFDLSLCDWWKFKYDFSRSDCTDQIFRMKYLKTSRLYRKSGDWSHSFYGMKLTGIQRKSCSRLNQKLTVSANFHIFIINRKIGILRFPWTTYGICPTVHLLVAEIWRNLIFVRCILYSRCGDSRKNNYLFFLMNLCSIDHIITSAISPLS